MTEYYKSIIGGIRIENFWDLLLQIGLQLRRQPIPLAISLKVDYPENTEEKAIMRHTAFIVRGHYLDDSQLSPFPKLTLCLEGKSQGKDIFALLEIALTFPDKGIQIILSPVPFGGDCKPELPFKDRQLAIFLAVAKTALSVPQETIWTSPYFSERVCKENGIPNYDFNHNHAIDWLVGLEKLGLLQCIKEGTSYKPAMDIRQFKEIFGVKLPEPPKPGIKQPWLVHVGP